MGAQDHPQPLAPAPYSATPRREKRKLAASRDVLLAARAKRVRPGWDDKVLADWNGLMIAALANAGRVFDAPDWLDGRARPSHSCVRT